MNLQDSIKYNTKAFLDLCNNHDVKMLYAFGSATNGRFNSETSDIDLLVEIFYSDSKDPIARGENLLELWDKFELFFKRKVDLLTYSSLINPILLKSINSSKILLYDGTKQKISI